MNRHKNCRQWALYYLCKPTKFMWPSALELQACRPMWQIGVSTDRETDRQTHNEAFFHSIWGLHVKTEFQQWWNAYRWQDFSCDVHLSTT